MLQLLISDKCLHSILLVIFPGIEKRVIFFSISRDRYFLINLWVIITLNRLIKQIWDPTQYFLIIHSSMHFSNHAWNWKRNKSQIENDSSKAFFYTLNSFSRINAASRHRIRISYFAIVLDTIKIIETTFINYRE